MGKNNVDVIMYPTTSIPAPSRAELDNGKWTTFTYPTNTLRKVTSSSDSASGVCGNLPVGLEFMGAPYSENILCSKAFAFEQRTRHRSSPAI